MLYTIAAEMKKNEMKLVLKYYIVFFVCGKMDSAKAGNQDTRFFV